MTRFAKIILKDLKSFTFTIIFNSLKLFNKAFVLGMRKYFEIAKKHQKGHFYFFRSFGVNTRIIPNLYSEYEFRIWIRQLK